MASLELKRVALVIHDDDVTAAERQWGERILSFVLDMAERDFDVASREYVAFLIGKDFAKARILATREERDGDSHAGKPACPHFAATGAEVVRLFRCDFCGEVRDAYVDDRVTDPLGATPDAPHVVEVSGPPVQSTEPSP